MLLLTTMINIHASNGSYYIWNAGDACHVREKCRIVGTLVGCLPRLPRQNLHLGLPLQLSSCEARFLIEKGFAKLHDDSNQIEPPSTDELQAFKLTRQQSYTEQLEACKLEKQKTMLNNLDRIVVGKKQKLKSTSDPDFVPVSKKKMKRKMKSLICESRNASGDKLEDEDLRLQIQQQIDNLSIPVSLPEKAVCIQIPTANWWPNQVTETSEAAWSFDEKPRDTLLYRVFCHFWEMGYFLTSGGKFGGDFLIYPGDPSRYHSFYIAVCLPYDQSLPALEIIALGRLGTGVKKTVLLCSVDSSEQVCFTSLQWSGIS